MSAAAVPLLDAHEATALAIWAQHIATRQPAVLQNALETEDFSQLKHWTNEYLLSRVGEDVQVTVEVRRGAAASFGRGITQVMPFQQFLRRFAAGDSSMYMTAQDVGIGPDGHPELFAASITQLQADVPLQPQCMGHLIPQQLNLWLGHAPDGASSGLHHDFHDNLYLLLRGRKRFRLYPPDQAQHMYTHGRIAKIHSNGRIVYTNQCWQHETNADGSRADEVAAWRERSAAEADVAAAQAAVQQGEKGAITRLKAAEARLDDALERVLDLQMGNVDDFEDGCPADEPSNFSRIDLPGLSDAQIRHMFPKFPGKDAARIVELHCGQALYLPTGWFHEVTSFSAEQQQDRHQGHMAFSYWFHPPDNLSPDVVGFGKPYTSGFWPALWATRLPQLRSAPAMGQNGGELARANDTPHSNPAAAQWAKASTAADRPVLSPISVPISKQWRRPRHWLAACGRRRHQFMLMHHRRRRPC